MKKLQAVLGVVVMFGFLAMIPVGCGNDSGSSNIPTNRVYVMNMEDGILEPLVESASENNQSWEYTLTLENVAEEVLWFSDRPGRESGTVTMEYFVQTVWPKVFVQIPPNAILDGWIPPNVLNDGLYIILRDPQYDSGAKKLTFNITLEKSTMTDQHPASEVIFEDVKITVLNNNPDETTDIYSFVQVAPAAYFEETGDEGVYKLNLPNVYPESFYLQNAPGRFSFVYPTDLFDMAWSNIFGGTPPNASMTSYTEGGKLKVQIVTLDNPDYDAASNLLTYTATLLHGDIENNQVLNAPTLFIDAQDSPSCEKQMGETGFTKRLTIINSCGVTRKPPNKSDTAWLYLTVPTVIPSQWDFWQKTCGKDATVVWTGAEPGTGDKMVRFPLEIGKPYHFCIPDIGAASGKFEVFLEPCKKTGDDCMIGTLAGHDRNGTNTIFETTYACSPSIAHDDCATNPSKPAEKLSTTDYFDVSAVDGFTIPMYLEVTNASKLACTRSFTDASMLDLASFSEKIENDSTMHALATADPKLVAAIKAGYSPLTQDVDGRDAYASTTSPCKWLTGHQLGAPTNPVGPMNPNPGDTPNTASWYCCSCCGKPVVGPGEGPVKCDKGPDGVKPVGTTGYVTRLKELGLLGYSWQFDDYSGLMKCDLTATEATNIVLTLCPGKGTKALYPRPLQNLPYSKTQGWNWTNGKCTASNSKGTYTSLFDCQKVNMKYKCTRVHSGGDDNAVYHNFCLPVESGGQSYEDCKKGCTP